MGSYLGLYIEFTFDLDDSHLVEDLHNIYKKYGFNPKSIYTQDNISYEEAAKVNQKCFDERIDYSNHMEYRILWDGGFTSFMITTPIIDVDEGSNIEKHYSARRREMVLFPESEITDITFSGVLDLIADLYKLDYVYSIEIQKEG